MKRTHLYIIKVCSVWLTNRARRTKIQDVCALYCGFPQINYRTKSTETTDDGVGVYFSRVLAQVLDLPQVSSDVS